MSRNNFIALIVSTLTACATGVIIASVGIVGVRYAYGNFLKSDTSNNTAATIDNFFKPKPVGEEDEEDPTFVNRFSRAVMYSADDGKEIIESAKNSLAVGTRKVTAQSYAVFDLNRSTPLLEKNSEKLLPIASISKLITAVIARKHLDQEKMITLDGITLATYGNEGKLRAGEKLRVKELLYPLLMVSSNDSAEALARAYPGGKKKFIEEMNTWANSIGAYRTYFKDPSGLSPYNVSTVRDLALITEWILKNDPEIFEITKLKSHTIRTHTWVNPTHFLNLTNYVGGKNGYTPEANRTSIALFDLGRYQKPYLVVLLGSGARDNDTLDLLDEAVR